MEQPTSSKFSIEDDQEILEYLRNNYTRLYSPHKRTSLWGDIVCHLKNNRLEEWNVSAVEVQRRFLNHIINRMYIVYLTDTQTKGILYPFLTTKYNIKIRFIDQETQAPNGLSVRSINYHRVIIKHKLKRNCFDDNIYKLMGSISMPYLKKKNATTINIADKVYGLSAVEQDQLRSLVGVSILAASAQLISSSEVKIEPQPEQPSDQRPVDPDKIPVPNIRQWAMNLINEVWSRTPSGRALLDPNLKLSDYWNSKTGKYDLNLHK